MLSFSDEENRRSFCLFSTVSVVSRDKNGEFDKSVPLTRAR